MKLRQPVKTIWPILNFSVHDCYPIAVLFRKLATGDNDQEHPPPNTTSTAFLHLEDVR